MKKSTRVVVEVLVPPAIAALIVLALLAREGTIRVKTVGLVLVFSYAYAIIPSIAYATVMELAFARGVRPSKPQALLLSTVTGALCGLLIGLVFPEPSAATSILPMIAVGSLVGVVTGFILIVLSRGDTKNA